MNRLIFKMLLALGCWVIVMSFVACCKKLKQQSCRLYVYGSLDKIYQIDFDGKDSMVTLCGAYDEHPTKYYNEYGYVSEDTVDFGDKNFHLKHIYLRGSAKLSRRRSRCLLSILNRLNSRVVSDSVIGAWADTWKIYVSLEKQNIGMQQYGIKDPDLRMLVDSMIEYSPLFINDYSDDWQGMGLEQSMIRMYDKRKK